MVFHQIALMFGSQVNSPVHREFKLMPFGNSLFQYLDTFRIRQAHEAFFQDTLQTFNQALIKHVIEELHIVGTVVQSPLYTIFDEIFRQVHIVRNIIERHFRLNHPELCQVAGSIGILGTERRTECIDGSQCSSGKFAFQLSGNSQAGLLSEEVIIVNNGTVLIFLQVVKVLRSHLEHLACAFAVGSRDNRSMKIEESSVMEELVDGNRHIMTNTEHSPERIGTGTQMGYLTEELHGMTFLLQRIRVIASSQHFDFAGLHFGLLTGTDRFRQHTVYAQTSTGSNLFQHLLIEVTQVYYNLHIIYCRTVIQRDKVYLLTTSAGTNPALHVDHSAKIFTLQQVNNLCSTNLFHKTVIIPYYILLKRTHAQEVHLLFREVTPFAAAQAFLG